MKTRNSSLYSVAYQKCPRCHEGNMFEHAAFSTQFMKMSNNCPHCGLDLIQEPSFYFGAMYFSYAIQVAVFVAVYFSLRYTIDPNTWTYVIWMIVGSVAILPLNYRWSRAAWISLFVSYRTSK
ncbi:MAG: DUF983 domain-containing protein [Chryseolinea sp.]